MAADRRRARIHKDQQPVSQVHARQVEILRRRALAPVNGRSRTGRGALSDDIVFLTMDRETIAALDAAERECAETSLKALHFAERQFTANPTKRTFKQWVRATACYSVAASVVHGDTTAPEGSG